VGKDTKISLSSGAANRTYLRGCGVDRRRLHDHAEDAMSEYFDPDGGDVQYVDNGDGTTTELVDLDGDGQPDVAVYDNTSQPGYSEEGEPGDPGYGQDPDGDGWYGGDATFYSNDNIDTAISTNPGGEEGYIALGDGDFVSWG
jgi:hypothetical protein